MSRTAAPGPRGRRLLGSLLDVRRDRLRFVLRITRDYGDIVRFQMGPRHLFLLNHPDYFHHVLHRNAKNYRKGLGLTHAAPLFGQGLLTSDGDLWTKERRLLRQAFHRDRLESHAEEMVAASEEMLERWQDEAAAGNPIDVSREMARLTLDILGRTVLGVDLSAKADTLIAHFEVMSRWAMDQMASLLEIPLRFPTPANLRARRSLQKLDELVGEMIAERRQQPIANSDVLDLLLSSDPPLDEKLIRDEIMTLLVAGHETGAAVLSWMWHLLAQRPEVRRRLDDELAEVLGGRPPTMADIPRLETTRAVIEETMRLYPPVWLLPRRAVDEDEIGGYPVPAGSDVLLSVYSLHRHPEFWEAPEEFRPERFAPEAARSAAYLPFGGGPRACLGRFFGQLEITLVAATVAQEIALESLPGHSVEAEPLLTLSPRHGLPMQPLRRQTSVGAVPPVPKSNQNLIKEVGR